MDKLKKFVFDGILAAKDVQDVARSIQTETDLIRLATLEEATDPAWYAQDLVAAAHRCAPVYYRLFLFENKVRRLFETVLTEAKGPDWFNSTAVESRIRESARNRMEEEGAARFHGRRGGRLLSYVMLNDLGKIIDDNWKEFEDVLYRRDWVKGKFEDLRLTRNAVAHMADVGDDDLERLDVILRDWNRQVG
jgi:hypothetical protein